MVIASWVAMTKNRKTYKKVFGKLEGPKVDLLWRSEYDKMRVGSLAMYTGPLYLHASIP